jgi:flagellar biosynthesis GTPase FlhF
MPTRRVRQTCSVLLLTLLVAAVGCINKTESVGPTATNAPAGSSPNAVGDKSATSDTTAQAGGNIAACTALTGAEIESVQGEAFKETQGNEHTGGGLNVSHCVYVLPTYNKSLSLDITRNDKSNAAGNAVEQFWETRFRDTDKGAERERESERERERERGKEKSAGREQGRARQESEREREAEEAAKPRPVSGVGDEAFWVGSRIKGTLYVRQKDVVLILSIGGADDDNAKIKKTSALAQKALKRL